MKKYVNHVLKEIHEQSYQREELKTKVPSLDELKYWVNTGQLGD